MQSFTGKSLYFIGIKGTGMSSLALLLHTLGARIQGSDVCEHFYTEDLLEEASISWNDVSQHHHLPPDIQLVVCSDAWRRKEVSELKDAERRNIPVLSYSEMLGNLFSSSPCGLGISGVHGKTTTTALLAIFTQALQLPGTVVLGGEAVNLPRGSFISAGQDFFIAETCEYRKNFLHFHPSILIVTSIESDHQDFFPGTQDIQEAFYEYASQLAPEGTLIYCADDEGATALARKIATTQNRNCIPYGTQASGRFQLHSLREEPGMVSFSIGPWKGWNLPYPGLHSAANLTAAFAGLMTLCETQHYAPPDTSILQEEIRRFRGIRRRSEIVGRWNSVTFIDDYAHHPTAIRRTLKGYRAFYGNRRMIVDFMSHTYSRTEALLEEFSTAFEEAGVVIINDIYASARERKGQADGETLAHTIAHAHPLVHYEADFDAAAQIILSYLQENDIVITMGAGNNWEIGKKVLGLLK